MSIVVDDNELYDDNDVDLNVEGVASPENNFDMPEKFTNKSPEDIAKSYLELEKELGRKSNEIGELRKLTDTYLHQELTRNTVDNDPKKEDPKIKFDDLVDDPGTVISSAVKRELESVNKRFEEMSTQQRTEKFMAKNPDYMDISQSQEFYNWVGASPYRARQLTAAQSGDFDAAEEILQGYREQVKVLQTDAKAAEKRKRDEQLTNASTESAGTGASPDTIYTRAKLMALYINNPSEYERQRTEIERAYAEGRVK